MQEVITSGLAKFGKYVLHERLGAGGMAEVWLATLPGAEGIDKRCVLKRILPRYAGNQSFVKMFLEEARISISLQHGNIVPVFDFGEADGTYYLAMECVRGVDLRAVLRQVEASATRFSVELAAYVVLEVCRGLAYAHTKVGADGKLLGLVHRDVSPSNVLVSFEGDVKLTDFGIAKVRGSSVQTEAFELKGKIPYMSPEQARGEAIDARTDLWAAAVVLYELLTGLRPHDAKDPVAILEKVRAGAPIEPARSHRVDVPEELDRLIAVALSPDRSARYRDARAMQLALSRFLATRSPVTAADLRVSLRRLFPRESEGFNPAMSAERRAIEPGAEAPFLVIPPAMETAPTAVRAAEARVAASEVRAAISGTAPTEVLAASFLSAPNGVSHATIQPATVKPPGTTAQVAPGLSDIGLALAPTTRYRRATSPPRRLLALGLLAVIASGVAGAGLALMFAGGDPLVSPDAHPKESRSVGAAGPLGSLRPSDPAAAAPPLPEPLSAIAPAAPPADATGAVGPAGPEQSDAANRAPRSARTAGAAQPGTLAVTSVPWAEVFIDGRRRAESTPTTLKLSPGPHSVRLHNPESGAQDLMRVEIHPGKTTKVVGHPR